MKRWWSRNGGWVLIVVAVTSFSISILITLTHYPTKPAAPVAAVPATTGTRTTPAAPEPYWVTVPACEDAGADMDACVLYDQGHWYWYPRGLVSKRETVPAATIHNRKDGRLDVNVGSLR